MKRIEFEPSPELRSVVGEGVKPGQKVELMAEFKVKDDGDWCLVSIEGVEMPGYDKDAPSEKSEYVQKAMENMPQGYAAT